MSIETRKTDLDRCIGALQAVHFIQNSYASGVEGAKRVEEICRELARHDDGMGPHGGICKNVADAISKAFLSRPLG